MAPIDVVQAQAEEATRRQAVVNAEATLQNNELALKRLIVSGTDDPVWTSTINADRPADARDGSDRSRGRRAQCAREPHRSADREEEHRLRERHASQPEQPDAADAEPAGHLSARRPRRRAHAMPTIHLRRPTGADALGGIGAWEAPTWTVQFNFAYPIGTSQAEANKARQQIIIRQNQTTVKATELQIATEVTAAAIAIRNSLEAIEAARRRASCRRSAPRRRRASSTSAWPRTSKSCRRSATSPTPATASCAST